MNRKTLAAAALSGLALALPASASAESFGSKLNKNIQPSNAGTDGHACFDAMPGKCTRVMMEGYTDGPGVGSPKAPHDGKIKKLKIIAQGPGKFRPLLAKVRPGPEKAKVTYRGPKLRYDGQPDDADTYTVEKFKVNIKVKKKEYLAIESRRTSFLRCSSGGTNQLLFQPALELNDPFEPATGDDGCWLLYQAVYK